MTGAQATKPEAVVDCHVHILPPDRLGGLMRWMAKSFKWLPPNVDVTREEILADLRARNVTHFFNLVYPLEPGETDSLNEFNRALCEEIPHAAGWGSLHIENERKQAIVERCVAEAGFIGLKFHPFIQRFSITDPRMSPVYETLDSLRRPLMLHTGFDVFYRQSMPPAQIAELLERYPRMPLVAAHALYPKLDDAFALMERYPQFHLDLTNVIASLKIFAGMRAAALMDTPEAKIILEGVPRFADRIFFGTDHPSSMGTVDELYAGLEEFDFGDEINRKVRFDNAFDYVERYLPGRWERQTRQ